MSEEAPSPRPEDEPAEGEQTPGEAEAELAEAFTKAPSPPPPQAPGPASAGPAAAAGAPATPPSSPPTRTANVYEHVLRIRGDVDQTKAIALFLSGLTALLVVWVGLTAGGPQVFKAQATVGEGGVLPLPPEAAAANKVWVDDPRYSAVGPDEEVDAPREYRVVTGEAPPRLELSASAAGETLRVAWDTGSEPIVSHFLLPPPGKVAGAIKTLFFGEAFQAQCPNAECESRPGSVTLDADAGQALETYRMQAMQQASGEEVPGPQVPCPVCGTTLDGAIAIPLPPHNFRAGLVSTIERTFIGFGIAALICFPLGVLAGAYPPIKRFISPLEIAGGYTPPVALLPLAVAAVGVLTNPDSLGLSAHMASEAGRIGFLVAVISFWLYPLVAAEVESVDEVYVNTAYTLGATRWQVIRGVLVPISLAATWEHLRATYAIGWASIILAEGFGVGKVTGETGIGFFMVEMQRRHYMENYFAALLAILATGIAVDYAFKLVGRWLFPYRETS